MNTAPITTWEGAGAYFTFADNPAVLMVLSALTLAVCVGVIAYMIRHEDQCAKELGSRSITGA